MTLTFLRTGCPLFIQLKRSEIMTRRSATEYKQHPADWEMPIFRRHLHGHNEFASTICCKGWTMTATRRST